MDNNSKKISSKEISEFFSLYRRFDVIFREIIDYIPEILLPRGFNICGANFSVGTNALVIELDSLHYEDLEYLEIPLDAIINDTWKSYLDDLAREKIDRMNKQMEEEKAYKEKKELEEYQRLKEKFENLKS